MAKTYSNRTRDKQEVKAITDQLEEGLKELFANEKYKSYLSMMSKFHNYKIMQTINCGNNDDHSKVVNKNKKSTFHGSYVGRDSINGTGSGEQK